MMTNLSRIIMVIIPLILFSIFLSIIAIPLFGEENNTYFTSSSNSSMWNSSKTTSLNLPIDSIRPSVYITNPSYPPTVTIGKIIINGNASSSDSGMLNVSAAAHTFPFDGHYRIKLAMQPIPLSHNNWSHWSFPMVINKTGTYRLVITALDNAGNRNYAETTINAPIREKNNTQIHTVSKTTLQTMPKIAFVRPTFTEAAYQEHGFYSFYFKYGFPPFGKNITTDLDMLTVKTPRSVSEFHANDPSHMSNITALTPINGTELHDVSWDFFPNPQKFWKPFLKLVEDYVPNATVTVMRDEDVHDGHIFYANGNNNKTNAYDVLLLFHNEYVTQSEYDNLRQFVKNGGTVVFIDANALYAEVRYVRNNHTITLVKGHSWEFDGKAARRSAPERWYNESKQWVGGNFLVNDIKDNITFSNNPLNYTHFEEQFVNNPRDEIIFDYGIKLPKDYAEVYSKKNELPVDKHVEDIVVATYQLKYGKGKVIVLGLSGGTLVQNQAGILVDNQKFKKFFSNVVLPRAVCPKIQSCHL